MATTYLQMINRVRRRLSQPDVVTLDADDLTPAIGDFVNEAAREVLEGWDWDFLVRHDGVLTTVAKGTSTSAGYTANSVAADLSGTLTASDYSGDFVTRIVPTSDASFGDTAFRVSHTDTTGGNARFWLADAFPVTSGTGKNLTVFVSEYLLADTVGDVLSVRHQEQDLPLEFVARTHGFDQLIQRPHDSFSDSPEVVYVGAQITTTYDLDAEESAGTQGLGLMVYPVPESQLVLHYSYRYRHAAMGETTDTLAGVPEHVIDSIVNFASAAAYASPAVGAALDEGAKLRSDTMRKLERDFGKHRSDPSRRNRMQSHFGRSRMAVRSEPANRLVFHTE